MVERISRPILRVSFWSNEVTRGYFIAEYESEYSAVSKAVSSNPTCGYVDRRDI